MEFLFFQKTDSQLSHIRILDSGQVNCLHPLCEKKTRLKIKFLSIFLGILGNPSDNLQKHNLKGNPEKIDQMWTYIQTQTDWTNEIWFLSWLNAPKF